AREIEQHELAAEDLLVAREGLARVAREGEVRTKGHGCSSVGSVAPFSRPANRGELIATVSTMPAMYLLRFDMRAPADGPAAITDLYDAAIEMAAWGEQHGAISIAVSEHHASPDGYLPSPLILATAIAARTTTIPVMVAALLVPLHDPVHLAEDMAVLDVVSR